MFLNSAARRTISTAAAVVGAAAVVAGLSVLPASAATTQVAAGVTAPSGMLWLRGNLGGHFWVADHVQGLCRVDGVASNATLTHCDITAKAVGQPSYDPATQSVYVPDLSAKSQGVYRLTFDPVTETMGGNGGGVFGGGSGPVLLAPTRGLGGNKPFAVAVDPNDSGALYIGFRKTPSILRIRHPYLGVGDDPVTIGNSADGRQVRSMTMVSHVTTPATATTPAVATSALLVMDGNGIGTISNPKNCGSPNSTCNAVAQASLALTVGVPLTVASDVNVAAGGENSLAYIGNASSVFQWDTVSGKVTTLGGGLSNVSAIGARTNAGALATVWAGDDPTLGLAIGAGHLWAIQ